MTVGIIVVLYVAMSAIVLGIFFASFKKEFYDDMVDYIDSVMSEVPKDLKVMIFLVFGAGYVFTWPIWIIAYIYTSIRVKHME